MKFFRYSALALVTNIRPNLYGLTRANALANVAAALTDGVNISQICLSQTLRQNKLECLSIASLYI
jgi:hypothetical protein